MNIHSCLNFLIVSKSNYRIYWGSFWHAIFYLSNASIPFIHSDFHRVVILWLTIFRIYHIIIALLLQLRVLFSAWGWFQIGYSQANKTIGNEAKHLWYLFDVYCNFCLSCLFKKQLFARYSEIYGNYALSVFLHNFLWLSEFCSVGTSSGVAWEPLNNI